MIIINQSCKLGYWQQAAKFKRMMPAKTVIAVKQMFFLFLLIFNNLIVGVIGAQWDHSVDLDESFRVLWNIKDQDITFELQVRTLGYVGLGFTRDGTIYGADMAVGWIDHGHAYFQDRHIKKNSDGEPVVDPSQDYILLLGYENATHTVLRFKRKLDTCDITHDVPITNDTIRIIYMYSDDEPRRGSVAPGSLPDPAEALKSSRALYFSQRVPQDPIKYDSKTKVLELRNVDVELPQDGESVLWCKMFKLTDITKKHHLIRYEPVFESPTNLPYLSQMILYECQGSSAELEIMSRENGRSCTDIDNQLMTCNAIVGAWARGSEGFSFPDEAGYPLDSNQAKFFLLQSHYHNNDPDSIFQPWRANMVDSSGLRLYYTTSLRRHDTGVLSIGMDQNWRHIIPPQQEQVVSEGHCVEECTQRAFPRQGINIFAVMMQTHEIGRSIKLRQVRNREELQPIAEDNNFDQNYQEYRRLSSPVKSFPGDRLIAECTYDSSKREAITLGGSSAREETCLVLTLYYPRQKELTTCHSLPSLPTVLHSLGIDELSVGSNPVLISSPPHLAGMSLETRLMTYDWENDFHKFQSVTSKGAFKAICKSAKSTMTPGTESLDLYSPNITKTWKKPATCNPNNHFSYRNQNRFLTEPPTTDEDNDEDNIIESAARSKVSRSSATESMSLSGVSSFKFANAILNINRISLLLIVFIHSFRIS